MQYLKQIAEKARDELLERIISELPEYGNFDAIEVKIDPPPQYYELKYISLMVEQPPEGVKERMVERDLKLYGEKAEQERCGSILLAADTKDNIIKELSDDSIVEIIAKAIRKMEFHL